MACKYLTINGHEDYNQINTEDFIVDFKDFIDEKSNKVKINLTAIKKLLPYDGFYPQERLKQIAGIYNDEVLYSLGVNDSQKAGVYTSGSDYYDSVRKTLVLTQPLFSPGIIFNTIKAGIATSWPTTILPFFPMPISYNRSGEIYHGFNNVQDPEDPSPDPPYLETNDVISLWGTNFIFPFETILDPKKYFQNISKYNIYQPLPPMTSSMIKNDLDCLVYLDPTSLSKQLNSRFLNADYDYSKYDILVPSMSFAEIKDKSMEDRLYKSAINNFLCETVNIFLKNAELTSFASKEFEIDEIIPTQQGKVYALDVVIEKNVDFSMFNNYKSGSYGYIPPESLFGPPTLYRGNNENNVPEYAHDTYIPYQPYTPPYMRKNNSGRIRLIYSASSSGTTLQNIISNISVQTRELYDFHVPDIENYSTDDKPTYNQMNLTHCLNYDLISTNQGKNTYFIQTKFETPLINFNLCSFEEVSSLIGI